MTHVASLRPMLLFDDGAPETSAPSRLDVTSLTAAVSRGDDLAFDIFYRTWFDRCYAMAWTITRRDESFCLDVVQDAMLRVLKRIPRMATDRDLDRWMRRVVHTAALDRLRKESRTSRRDRRHRIHAPHSDASHEAELADRIAWVRTQLDLMATEDRAAVQLRMSNTLDSVGAATGSTGDASHGRIRRTLHRLRTAAREVFHD